VLLGVAGEGVDILIKIFFKEWSKASKRRDLCIEVGAAFFWALVVIGLVLEMSDAAKSDNEVVALTEKITQTSINLTNADPRNQPINAISGWAIVEVRAKGERETNLAKNLHQILADRSGMNFDLTTSTKLAQNPESVELVFAKKPNDSPSEPVGSDIPIAGFIDSVNTVVDDAKPYVPNFAFVLHFSGSDLWNPDSLNFNEMKFAQIIGLGNAGEVQSPLEVIGGQIHLNVNRDWPKTFKIPKQTNQFWRASSLETNDAFVPAGYGNLTNEPAAK
jgi:hypothetical protein